MSTYDVRAVPWAEGWELHVDGAGVTQVRTLDKAALSDALYDVGVALDRDAQVRTRDIIN